MLYFLVILFILFIVFLVCVLIDIKRSNKYKLENELFNNIMCNYINKGDIVNVNDGDIIVNLSGNHCSVYSYYEQYSLSLDVHVIIKINKVTVWDYKQDVLTRENVKLLKGFHKKAKQAHKRDKCLRYVDNLSNIKLDDAKLVNKAKLEQFKSILSKGK